MSESETDETSADASHRTEKATFAAGCFWKPEATYREVDGVIDTAVGYEGGHVENPSYADVCSGRTGHAEVVEVTFDPDRVSYAELLDRFWAMHDPTQVDRQGFDVGSQYRSAVFTHSDEQRTIAEASRDRAQGGKRRDIATEIEDAQPFWRAEEYHQCYLERRKSPAQMLRALIGR